MLTQISNSHVYTNQFTDPVLLSYLEYYVHFVRAMFVPT